MDNFKSLKLQSKEKHYLYQKW